MLRQIALAGFLAFTPFGVANAAVADNACQLQLTTASPQWKIDNADAFSSDNLFGSFELELVNEGDAACSVQLSLDTDGAPFGLSNNGPQRLTYSIFNHDTGVDLTPRTGHSASLNPGVVAIPPRSQHISRFDVVVPGNFQTDGTYSQILRIDAVGPGNGNIESASRNITLSVGVSSSATMALSGDFTRLGSTADIDLGEIESNMTRTPVMLHVRATRAYRISSSSQNGGKLRLTGTDWSIPYKMTLAGTSFSADGDTYTSPAGNTRRADNLPLGFVVGNALNVRAGRYSDVVTLSISVD